MLFLSLLLSIGTMAQAQKFKDVKRNDDGSYDKEVFFETFEAYIDTVKTLPENEDEKSSFVRFFFEDMAKASEGKEDNNDVLKIKDKSNNSIKDAGDTEHNQCLYFLNKEIVKRKQLQQQQQQQDATKRKKVKGERTSKDNQIGIWIGVAVVSVLIIAAIILLLVKSKKKNKPIPAYNNPSPNVAPSNKDNNNGSNDLIIRRKTSSVLHKQSLDDVVNDNNYMVVNCANFSNDTAVKTMYIKNSCIMDIYNMYAEDLRNPNNPKEDGCMVLGRWIHDEKADEYAVSLEEVVFPGDDAVFAEYELDFGGKIKVKVNERLRKLRRETNLQYDLTCWVHSHPGLGVFFSNTDCSLHLLHKHPTHPKFLTAIVIDILTPQQELGIFTFKHDLSINSKADLKQLYSLEEWYKWAVESKRAAVFFEEHFNTLEKAKSRNDRCYNIQLSNSTIIDIDLVATNQDRDLYFVHGFSTEQSGQTSYVAVKIENTDAMTDNELIGCFMVVTHRSFPTINKAVANYLGKIKFVLVYSIADGMLTSIPVIFNDLCADESYYGEQPLEELKIWTRRKR